MSSPKLDNRQSSVVTLTRIQKLIGQRMSESKRSKPCFYIELKADVTELMASRPRLRKSLGVKITTNAFYIRALALAVKKFPLMIGRLDRNLNDGFIRIPDCVNVGFAVTAPHGLVVPVVKMADKMTLAEIARLEKTLTEKARGNKLSLEQLEGETIALSNLGAYGIDSFIGIVPLQSTAILAVGNAVRMVIPDKGKPTVRRMASLNLAADSRVVSAAYSADFLVFIKEQLQRPQKLL